jgi:hypothetical protein
MGLKKRIIKLTFDTPSGQVVITQGLKMFVRVHKAALVIQNRATMEIFGLDTQLRQRLTSQLTAWRKRLAEQGDIVPVWIPVSIVAGYEDDEGDHSTLIFKGECVLCEPSSPPPNISIKITAYTNQINKATFVTDPAPAELTFKEYVIWASIQMNLGDNPVCDTSYNDTIITNPSRSTHVASSLLIDIQNAYRMDVAAYVDDGRLIVKDIAKLINPADIAFLDTFVGAPPSWNEWGIQFQTMFNPEVRVGQAVEILSITNPSTNGQYVVTELDYDLSSRDKPFYVRGSGAPPS